jgi:hypothetical protein
MATMTTSPAQKPGSFGETARRDNWWAGPLATLIGLLAFVIYATWSGLQGQYFEIRNEAGTAVAPYLSPFYSPLLYDSQSPHAWFQEARPSWWPNWLPFSAAVLILAVPVLFRFTCYYYRKAYYRAFWADPPACVVGEPRTSYWGENHWPLLLQNAHRYALYLATFFLLFLWWDVLHAFWWPTDQSGALLGGSHQIGVGVGTVVMLINVILLTGFTLGCNSLRHLVGGRLDCFSCPGNVARARGGYKAWHFVTRFNEHHSLWAWLSLFSVGFADVYIRLCAMGIWHDVRLI